MKRVRDEELAKEYRGKPCVVCGSTNSEGDHIKTFGSGGACDHFNMWALCRHHHIEKGFLGLRVFSEKYPKLRAILGKKGWLYNPVFQKWYRLKEDVKVEKEKKVSRQCLKCDKFFNSVSRFNKLCKRCQEENKSVPETMGIIK